MMICRDRLGQNPNAWHGRWQIHRRLMVSKVLASPESQFSILQMDSRNHMDPFQAEPSSIASTSTWLKAGA